MLPPDTRQVDYEVFRLIIADGCLYHLAASHAIEAFDLKDPQLYLFGSVDSLLKTKSTLFPELNQIASYTYINIGLESVDQSTLAKIKKPLSTSRVRDAFKKMLQINTDFANLEITANFLLGGQFPPGHYESLAQLLQGVPDSLAGKGAVYLSPLINSRNKEELPKSFLDIKDLSRLPAYIYTIQRLWDGLVREKNLPEHAFQRQS